MQSIETPVWSRLIYIYEVLKRLRDDAPLYNLLHRVLHEQYIVEKGKVIPRDKKTISSDSLQSPDDPDATYRNKDGQKEHEDMNLKTECMQ